ncbi:MAG: GTP 3',8-cyclase [Desulfovibrio sp.]
MVCMVSDLPSRKSASQAGEAAAFHDRKPLPDSGLISVSGKFSMLRIALTSRCHNRCLFCGFHGPRATPPTQVDMSMEDLDLLIQRLPSFSGAIELAGNGEPSLLENLPERIGKLRRAYPGSYIFCITTLNIEREAGYMANLFEVGLDSLRISCCGYNREEYGRAHGYDGFSALCRNIETIKTLPERHRRKIAVNTYVHTDGTVPVGKNEFYGFLKRNGIPSLLQNYVNSFQGRTDLPSYWGEKPPPHPCSAIWGGRAGMLNIRANLDIVPCPFAFDRSDMAWGNLRHDSLEKIFCSPAYTAFSQAMWNRDLEAFPLCAACDQPNFPSSQAELFRLAAYEASRLYGREVFFWGMGEAYRMYKIFFNHCKPLAMLSDFAGNDAGKVDGIPVRHPDAVLGQRDEHDPIRPVVVFAYPPNNRKIVAAIREKYPEYASCIILAHANLHREQSSDAFIPL